MAELTEEQLRKAKEMLDTPQTIDESSLIFGFRNYLFKHSDGVVLTNAEPGEWVPLNEVVGAVEAFNELLKVLGA